MEEGKRHCAFCFIQIAEKEVKHCGKCHRRAYCGQKCQKKDWKSKKTTTTGTASILLESMASMLVSKAEIGQGHQDWCGLPICEEDLDYFVKEGGKGVVAKRLIRQGERILVGNAAQLDERPASGVATIMLFKHSCDANAIYNSAMDYKVSIITASEDIHPGTEITYDYIGFRGDAVPTIDFSEDGSLFYINSFEDSRKALESKCGIICPKDCFCYNKEMEKLIIKRKRVTKGLYQLLELNGSGVRAGANASMLKSVNSDMVEITQKIIAEFDVVRGNPVVKAQMICILLKVLARPENLKYSHLIPNYEKEASDIFKTVFHPNSPYSKLEVWRNNSFGVGF